eukprot:COSAG01_NODE_6688_length_3541_cov_3.735038_2_plen_77_part_00
MPAADIPRRPAFAATTAIRMSEEIAVVYSTARRTIGQFADAKGGCRCMYRNNIDSVIQVKRWKQPPVLVLLLWKGG